MLKKVICAPCGGAGCTVGRCEEMGFLDLLHLGAVQPAPLGGVGDLFFIKTPRCNSC